MSAGESDSSFSNVIFDQVTRTYLAGESVSCRYRVTHNVAPSSRDWVGLYRVPWTLTKEHVYYEWAPMPKEGEEGYKAGQPYTQSIVFPANKMPQEDDEYYQFCYVNAQGQVQGASAPFQFVGPDRLGAGASDEYLEEGVGWDDDILIITPKTAALDQKLQQSEKEKVALERARDKLDLSRQAMIEQLKDVTGKYEDECLKNTNLRIELKGCQHRLGEVTNLLKKVKQSEESQAEESEVLKKEVAELQHQGVQDRQTLQDEVTKNQEMTSKIDQIRGELASAKEKLELFTKSVASSEQTAESYMTEVTQLKAQVEEASAAYATLQVEMSALKLKADATASTVKETESELAAARETATSMCGKLEALQNENHDMQRAIALKNGQLKDIEKERNELLSDVNLLREKLEETKKHQDKSGEGEDAAKALRVAFTQLKKDKKVVDEELKKSKLREAALRKSNQQLYVDLQAREQKLVEGRKKWTKLMQRTEQLEEMNRKFVQANVGAEGPTQKPQVDKMEEKPKVEKQRQQPTLIHGKVEVKDIAGGELTPAQLQLIMAARAQKELHKVQNKIQNKGLNVGRGERELPPNVHQGGTAERTRKGNHGPLPSSPKGAAPRPFKVKYPEDSLQGRRREELPAAAPRSPLHGKPMAAAIPDYPLNMIDGEEAPDGTSPRPASPPVAEPVILPLLPDPERPIGTDLDIPSPFGPNLIGGEEGSYRDDAVVFDSGDLSLMACPLCQLLFDPDTSEESRVAHIEAHQDTRLRPDKKVCPMCSLEFPLDTDQEKFVAHVDSHF